MTRRRLSFQVTRGSHQHSLNHLSFICPLLLFYLVLYSPATIPRQVALAAAGAGIQPPPGDPATPLAPVLSSSAVDRRSASFLAIPNRQVVLAPQRVIYRGRVSPVLPFASRNQLSADCPDHRGRGL